MCSRSAPSGTTYLFRLSKCKGEYILTEVIYQYVNKSTIGLQFPCTCF